jgi:hypothetical protein
MTESVSKLNHNPTPKLPDLNLLKDPSTKKVTEEMTRLTYDSYKDIYDDLVKVSVGRNSALPTASKDYLGKYFLKSGAAEDTLHQCVYNSSSQTYSWKQIQLGLPNDLWEVDGTESQLKTANDIDMQSKKIINLLDPTTNQDAATKVYTDGKISKTTAGEINAMTEKTTVVGDDLIMIEDSAASHAKKKIKRSTLVSSNIQIFISDGTFTVPAGITKVYLSMVGGGGGGGGLEGGGGGGGESLVNFPLTVTPGASLTVTIGAGGTGGTAGGGNGTNGGSTSFDSISVAGGSLGTGNSGTGGSGGGGVSRNASGVTGGTRGLGGGNGADKPGAGAGGGGGGTFFGHGGTGGSGAAGGTPVANTGAGGGGGGANGGGKVGGDGAAGIVIVIY